ncbi:PR domain zinc finger protein 13 [Aix galericulata]|nr:PR domain zinc finger protein 13 [Aix galericulata]
MQTSRAPAISVSAESCIPAGLRLGPVPGIFKLGKYLSDRREPGPKKKGKPAWEKRLPVPLPLRSSLARVSQDETGEPSKSGPRFLLAALASHQKPLPCSPAPGPR